LKYSDNKEETEWIAWMCNKIKNKSLILPKYIKSINGNYVEEGWSVYNYIKGSHKKNNWKKKKNMAELFHKLLKNLSCPIFFKNRKDLGQ